MTEGNLIENYDNESYTWDWLGDAAMEDSMVNTSSDLYELAGLDHMQWVILDVEAFAFSHGRDPEWQINVRAFHCGELDPDDSGAFTRAIEEAKGEDGSIPVKDIKLHDVSLDDLVKCMKLVSFKVRNPHVAGDLRVVELGDHPQQD